MIKFKKIIVFTLIFSALLGFAVVPDALAAKKKKKITDEEITQITTTINTLVKKVYASGLFSPKDNEDLIDIKLQLDDALLGNPNNNDFPQLYYKTGFIYREREYREEAIECFQTVLDNFPDSPYAAKAMNELKKMGVKITSPDSQDTME
ncbi:MAG: hypothetical protein A2287_06680 [Candidatus Melainabacteria bacterium RIFOXYA12_FULL_32_12]|nr:MAG: hypothetical protein A2255_00195 [Candidatus Melainabacteria bacterium RIFOXYA2_FULL_32_9]OGI25416.1 MAG: hypothetical protein A2287_06680 [Candidatus Melainabacteria bacterium RIFOXYA12_FULL_32_12]